MATSSPFVLLDDARGVGRLFVDPVEVVTAQAAVDVAGALEAVRAGLARGLHAAGYLGYEAGSSVGWVPDPGGARSARSGTEPLPAPEHGGGPSLWFGLFRDCRMLGAAEVAAWLPDPAGAFAGPVEPLVDAAWHAARVRRAKDYIASGDIYQVNLTFPCRVPVIGDPRALYARLRTPAAVGWGALVFTGDRWLLSCSPELFFTLDADRHIVARPMKGTAPAAAHPATLRDDPKQRAENLMIVDLLRNDLSRVAVPGSVTVPRLFEVEHYPTVLQMTSTVTATLDAGTDAIDILAAAFPCGSITGAPKHRAMQIIGELEPHCRGAYTGSIGHIAPDGPAAFNVAIRTLELLDGADHAVLGLGSGIVADSQSAAEWRECLAKGAFVNAAPPEFDLVETMRFDPLEGIVDLERHLARLTASARALGFGFDRHDVRNELQAASFRLRAPTRLRLLLAQGGAVAIEAAAAPSAPIGISDVALVPLPVDPRDVRLLHKTTDRDFYDAARRQAGTFEVVFVDAGGFVTEGSFTNLFVERDGRLLTPPSARGLLPGVLRARLLAEGRAMEADLRPDDLAAGFLVGNALRGLMAARLVEAP